MRRQTSSSWPRWLVLAGIFGGCAPLPPVPQADIPSAWPRTAPAQGSAVATEITWRQFFSDPRLQALIDMALANNRDMRMAISRVAEARAQDQAASAERIPAVSLTLGQSGAKFPAELAGSGNPIISRRADLGISVVSFELDFWNRVSSLSEAAQARLLASEEARRSLRITLIAIVANHYFSLLELEQRIDISRQQVASREKSLALQRRAMELGASARSEVLLAEAAADTARSELSGLENQYASTEHSLHQLIGKPATAPLPTGRSLQAQDVRSDLAPGIPSDVIAQRPDVLAAENRLREAQANIVAARAAFLPRIMLTAGLGFASRSLAGLFLPGTGNWSYQPTISLPLFDGGRTTGQFDAAAARQEQAVADYERTIQQAFREIADQLASRESLSNQRRAADATLRAQQERMIVAEARFNAGSISYMEVLDVQRELFAAQQNQLQIIRAQLTASTQLYKALGGGLADERERKEDPSAATS